MKTVITGSMLVIIALSASGTVFADYTKNCDGCRITGNILHCDQCNAAKPAELDISLCGGQEITNCRGRLQCGPCLPNQPFTYPAGFDGPYKTYCHTCRYNINYRQLSCACGNKDVKGNVGPNYQIIATLDLNDPKGQCAQGTITFYPDSDKKFLSCPKGSNPY